MNLIDKKIIEIENLEAEVWELEEDVDIMMTSIMFIENEIRKDYSKSLKLSEKFNDCGPMDLHFEYVLSRQDELDFFKTIYRYLTGEEYE